MIEDKKKLITKELMSLVLGKEVLTINELYTLDKSNNYIRVFYGIGSEDINLDTLGRLCMRFITNNGYVLELYADQDVINIELWVDGELEFSTLDLPRNKELEAMVKCAEWVAKKEGLLK